MRAELVKCTNLFYCIIVWRIGFTNVLLNPLNCILKVTNYIMQLINKIKNTVHHFQY